MSEGVFLRGGEDKGQTSTIVKNNQNFGPLV